MTFSKTHRDAQRRLLVRTMAFALAGVLCALPASCDSVSCPLNNKVECVYGFYTATQTGEDMYASGKAVSVGDTITITALGPDTVLANRLVDKSEARLPVSFYEDMDVLQFKFTDQNSLSASDTIWLTKTNQHHWDDPSCAVHIWHTITAVRSTHHLIDSVVIKNREINYDGLENLQIFFRTSANDEDKKDTEE